MGRSTYKVLFVHRAQIGRFLNTKKKRDMRKDIHKHMVNKYISVSPLNFFWKRASTLNKKLINKRICVFNGMIFHIINTNIKFKGLKLGEFSVSRKKPMHTGKRKQIKKIRNIIPKKKYF